MRMQHESYFFGVLREGNRHQLWKLGENRQLTPCGPSDQRRFPPSHLVKLLPPKPEYRNVAYPERQALVGEISGLHTLAFWDWTVELPKPIATVFMSDLEGLQSENLRLPILVQRLCTHLPRFGFPAIVPFTGLPPPEREVVQYRKKNQAKVLSLDKAKARSYGRRNRSAKDR